MFNALILSLPFLALSAHSLSIPFSRRQTTSDDEFTFQNNNNESSGGDSYTATITLENKQFVLLVDTGSSDLWIDTAGLDLSGIHDSGIPQAIQYADNTVASGDILIANVTLGDFTLQQAFISAPGSNATRPGENGIIGVGPPSLSQIQAAFQQNKSLSDSDRASGNPFLENVFISQPSLPPIATFQLSRSLSTGFSDGGLFTVGEVVENMTDVLNQPVLPLLSNDRFTVAMDGIVVNGQKTSGNSTFSVEGQDVEAGQTLALLDTGTVLARIPFEYANAIYDNVPGAQGDASTGSIFLPCDTKLNVSFIFGGVEIPIHPIDVVQATSDGKGGVICTSGFFGVGTTETESDEADFLLGDTFMRNVYAVFNYGSLVGRENDPQIQLLATTDPNAAFAEFDSLSAARNATILSASASNSTSSSGSSTSSASPSPTRGEKSAAMRLTALPGGQSVSVSIGVILATALAVLY